MQVRETIYLNRDNDIELALTTDKVVINHLAITKVKLVLTEAIVLDSSINAGVFNFSNADSLVITAGGESIPEGIYADAYLVIYTADYPLGLVWDSDLEITVVDL